MRRMIRGVASLLALIIAPIAAQAAQPLADKVPADAVIYAGWAGTDALGASYQNSNLKGMVDAMDLQAFLTKVWAKGMEQAQTEGKADDAQLFKDVMSDIIKSPTAFFIESMDMTDPRKPVPNLAIISQIGKDAPDLAKRLGAAMEKNKKETDPPMSVKAMGDFLVLTVGSPADLAPFLSPAGGKPVASLSADKGFLDASKQVADSPAVSVYVSAQPIMHFIMEAAKADMPAGGGPNIEQVFDAIGLMAFKHGMLTGTFDGKGWSQQVFVEMDKDRRAYAAFLDNKPLSDDALKGIPATAAWASVTRFDAKRLLADVRTGALLIDPAAAQQIDFALIQGGNFLGIDINKDLIENQSDEWIFYGNADAAGNSIRGMTLTNQVKDEKTAAETYETLRDMINAAIAQRGGVGAKQITEVKKGDLKLQTVELPELAPTWTVANGRLIITISPAAAESAATFDGKSTLADNPVFQGLIKSLGVTKYSSFSFVDLPKTAPEMYEVLNKVLTYAASQAKEGDPKFTLPPLEKIKPFLSPSMDVCWSDEAGFHMKSTEPFPGSSMFGGATISVESLMLPFIKAQRDQNSGVRGQTPAATPATPPGGKGN